MSRRVLVIAYYFPPLGLSGVQRTLKFVKYLPDFGWLPTVLTVDDRGYFAKDEGLLDDLKGRPVEIVRTPSLDPLHFFRKKNVVPMPSGFRYTLFGKISSFFFIPDNKIGWRRHAVAEGKRILAQIPHDMIFSTAPPYTDFLIASELKRSFGLPLVFDYRDAWLENPLHSYPTPLHRFLHRRKEAHALRSANHVITINRQIKESIVRNNPHVSHHDVSIIPQGFDPEDFTLEEVSARDSFMRITHAGTFYFNRSPVAFVEGLLRFFEQTPEARRNVKVTFAGNAREEDARIISRNGLDDCIEMAGYLPHDRCVRLLQASDVLMIIIGSGRGEEMISTGKLYEYIGAKKPILATIPDGAARRVLEKHGAAFIANPDDAEGIANHLSTLYALHRKGALPKPSSEFVSNFDRRELTRQLAQVFASALIQDSAESIETGAAPDSMNQPFNQS